MFGKRKKQVVGCDVGSSAIKIVELKPLKNGEFQLLHAAIADLSPEAIVDGTIMDSSLVVEAVSRLVSENAVKNPAFGGSLSGHAVIIKKIQLPAMSEAELAESIQWEAEQYIPFDINDVNLDYMILDDQGVDTMDVLLVAVKKDRIADYTSAVIQAGKDPVLVDVDVFSIQNAYETNYDMGSNVVALVNVGASVMNINILDGENSVFWRDVAFGGNQYTEAIQRELNLPREDAERLKLGEKVGEHTVQEIVGVLNSVSEDLAAELQKTIDFFLATSSAVDKVEQVVLAGGGAQTLNLDEVLKERFQVGVEIMNPFRNIRYSESDFDPEWINRHASSMAVAVGLAVRTVGD